MLRLSERKHKKMFFNTWNLNWLVALFCNIPIFKVHSYNRR